MCVNRKNVITKLLIIVLVVILSWWIVLPEVSVVIRNGEIEQFESDNEEESKYYINTAQDMWDFAEKVNNGESFKDIEVYLTSDINLECNEDNQWIPIGTYANRFRGIFDGQGHTVSGLYIKSNSSYMGLFTTNNGTIKNLNVANSYIESVGYESTASQNIGFIAAYNCINAHITNCNVTASEIESASEGWVNAGGICAYNSGIIEYCENASNIYTKTIVATGGIVGENYDIVRKSKNTGTIIGGDNTTGYNSTGIGGIVGSNHSKVSLCTNYGIVKAEAYTGSGFIGGIVGTNFDGNTEIFTCSNLGNIEGKLCGGIVGRNGSSSNARTTGGTIKNSYNLGEISASSAGGAICYSNKVEGKIQNCYYLESDLNGCVYDKAEENTSIIEKAETEMKKSEFVQLLNTEGKQYEYVENNYPELDLSSPNIEVIYDSTDSDKILVTLKADENIRDVLGWTIADDKQTLTKTFYLKYNEKIILEDYNYNQTIVEVNIDSLSNSLIIEENYYINTFEDLQILAQEVNSGNNMENKNIYLMNDIEIPQNYIWDVIGNSSENIFMGNFYGNNKKISGINIDGYSYYKGLFGYIKNAYIEGLVVEGEINGESKYTGGIAAYSYCSYIEECTNSIVINEENNPYDNQLDDTWGARVGGIVGYSWNDSYESIITNCTNNGKITYITDFMSSAVCGGIAGDVQGTTISYCVNNANIISTDSYYTGGITGESRWSYKDGYGYIDAQVIACYNKGNITSNTVPQGLGGITGEVNEGAIINSYNLGNVEYTGTSTSNGTASINNIGGIVGRTYNSIIIKNCYNIGQSKSGGIVGVISSTDGNINNNYYLQNCATTGYCSSNLENIEIINKTSEEMQSADFVKVLNKDTNIWRQDIKNINLGYPRLAMPALRSEKYEITEMEISKITQGTKLEDFINGLIISEEVKIQVINKNGEELASGALIVTGMSLIVKDDLELKTLKLVVTGDVTGDGAADFKDIVAINGHRLNKKLLEGEYLMAGEVTGDEKVDFKDIVKINMFRLGKITELLQ